MTKALTGAQQALAAQYIPLARSLALRFKTRWPKLWKEFDSAALLGLVLAARSFDEAREVKFATFARYRIKGALEDVKREQLERVRKWGSIEDGAAMRRELPHAIMPFSEPAAPVESPPENADLLEHFLGKLPARHAAICRATYLEGLTLCEAGKNFGLAKSRVRAIQLDALDRMSQMAEYEGYSREDCA